MVVGRYSSTTAKCYMRVSERDVSWVEMRESYPDRLEEHLDSRLSAVMVTPRLCGPVAALFDAWHCTRQSECVVGSQDISFEGHTNMRV